MNPAVAYGWWHHFNEAHSLQEQLVVFWAAPFAGAIAGGLLYRAVRGSEAASAAPRHVPAAALKAAAAAAGKGE